LSEKNPAVSIVIPMYNAEKYIGECLDSVLAQTFTDYEVIIVDDCSTDKSCEIVESYKPIFNGNLQLICSEKNFGYPGLTRNKGVEKATGKYLCFIDGDDAIIKDALKEIYFFAEKFKTDVLHFDKYFVSYDDNISTNPNDLELYLRARVNHVDKPTLLTSDLVDRVDKFINCKLVWEPWNNIIRREFIEKNNLKFPPDLSICDDLLFNFTTITTAETVVIMPQAFYIWRQRKDSISNEKMPLEKAVKKIGGDLVHGLDFLEKFLNSHKIFDELDFKKFKLLIFFAEFHLNEFTIRYSDKLIYNFENIFLKELATVENKSAIISFFINYINWLKVRYNNDKNRMTHSSRKQSRLEFSAKT